MATAARPLTFEEFQAQYRDAERTYEYWYGEAVPKGMPTWVHGLLQKIVMQLLEEAGFISAPEIELRIEADAYPRPDVVATRTKPTGKYPTSGLDIVVEVISEDDKYSVIRSHCRKYQEWGFRQIYLVDPSDRTVAEWRDGSQVSCSQLAGIPVDRIWQELDRQHSE